MAGEQSTSFDDFMRGLKEEAVAAGPSAVAQLRQLEQRFGLASDLIVMRRAKAITQSQLAVLTGVHQSEISRIERGVGNPTAQTLARLGSALGARLTFVPDSALPRH
jgi:XRE family transcriptional regulator, regulator of sulfur utilization